MPNEKTLLIKPTEGYSPHIGTFVSMMQTCRSRTIQTIENLSNDALDFILDEQANSIGALLVHIAAIEVAYQEQSFFKRNILDNPEKYAKWSVGMNLGEEARKIIKNKPIGYYLNLLHEVREESLGLFKKHDDDWFFKTRQDPWDEYPVNNYFRWWHTLEDEVNHRGQIVWLKLRLDT